jgi:predicted dehydrogenase
MKILIAGLGSIGRRHLTNLASAGIRQLAAVTQGRCVLPTDTLPAHLTFERLEVALDWGPDAVFICNPTALHLETALAVAEAGCHIFLEKPVSHNLDGLDELARLADEKNLVLQVGFQFRFHGVFQEIQKRIAAGHIGKVISAQVHWGEYLPGWHPWEDYRQSYSAREDLGGGVVRTLCHPFDYLRWLVGEVDSVQAIGGHLSNLQTDTEDAALALLRFQNGAIGSVYLDYISRPSQHTLHIIGEQGRVEWEAQSGAAKLYTEGGARVEALAAGRFFDRNEMFRAEVDHFLDCLRHARQPACTLHDGIRALEIALAAKMSMANTTLEFA